MLNQKFFKKNKNKLIFIFLIVIVLFISLSFLISKNILFSNQSIKSKGLSRLYRLLKKDGAIVVDRNFAWWVSADGWSIVVEDGVESIGLGERDAYKNLQDENSEASQLVNEITSYFLNHGYVQNKDNSSTSASDDSFFDFIRGFENGEEKCLLIVNPDGGYGYVERGEMVRVPSIVISCFEAESFRLSYDEQIPFLWAVGDRRAVLSIVRQTDSIAHARINWRRSGAYVLFAKIGESWKVVYQGQDNIPCEIRDKYNFPKDIYDSCN